MGLKSFNLMKRYACLIALIIINISLLPAFSAGEEPYLHIDIVSPEEGDVLTGGHNLNITWDINSSYNLSDVSVYIEYVYNDTGPHSIGSNLSGNITDLTWDVPEINSGDVLLIFRAEVVDERAWKMVKIGIDSTSPKLISYSPISGDTIFSDQCIEFVFSEEIDRDDFASSFNLLKDNEDVSGNFNYRSVGGNFIASYCPVGKFELGEDYTFVLNGTLRDISKPGNNITKDLIVDFIIVEGAPSVTISEPRADVDILVGEKLNITWSIGDSLLKENSIDISYSVDGGETWYSIRSGIEDIGKIQWTIPNMMSFDYPVNAVINVSARSINGYLGYAHSNEILIRDNIPPEVEVLRPYPNSYIVRNQRYTIKWEALDNRPLPEKPILISVSTDKGQNWRAISNMISNSGVYEWKVDTPPGEVLVNVSVTDSFGVTSWSHSPPLNVLRTNPLSMEFIENSTFYYSREVVNITWESPELSEDMQYIRLNITYNGGSSWSTLREVEANRGYANIAFPFQMSSECMIRLKVLDDEGTLFYHDSHMFEIMPRLLDSSIEQADDFTLVYLRFEGWLGLSVIQRAFTLYRDGERVEVESRDILQITSSDILFFGRELSPGHYEIMFDSEDIGDRDFSQMKLASFTIEGEEEETFDHQYLFALVPVILISTRMVYHLKNKRETP